MARKKGTPAASKLPKAPLVEAVFELRWALQGAAGTPVQLQHDPGFLQTQEAFTKRAAKLGFPATRDMASPQDLVGGYGISRRYYLAPDKEFPILQIGPGIFATNQSSEYDWPSFKKQVISGVTAVLGSYPSLQSFPLTPTHLELRYVDAFDESLVGTTDILKFLEAGTEMRVTSPQLLSDRSVFENDTKGRILLGRDAKKWKSSHFTVDVGSGRRMGEEIIRLESKVVTVRDGVPKLRKQKLFLAEVEKWLEFAHNITSPFFVRFVGTAAMKKFETT